MSTKFLIAGDFHLCADDETQQKYALLSTLYIFHRIRTDNPDAVLFTGDFFGGSKNISEVVDFLIRQHDSIDPEVTKIFSALSEGEDQQWCHTIPEVNKASQLFFEAYAERGSLFRYPIASLGETLNGINIYGIGQVELEKYFETFLSELETKVESNGDDKFIMLSHVRDGHDIEILDQLDHGVVILGDRHTINVLSDAGNVSGIEKDLILELENESNKSIIKIEGLHIEVRVYNKHSNSEVYSKLVVRPGSSSLFAQRSPEDRLHATFINLEYQADGKIKIESDIFTLDNAIEEFNLSDLLDA